MGPTADQTWWNLLQGRSAIRVQQPFADLPPLPLAMCAASPADLDDMLLNAVDAALRDAALHPPLPDIAVVVGSSRGYQARWEAIARNWVKHQTLAIGTDWLDLLPSMAAAKTAQYVSSSGPVRAPMAACATGILSLFQAWEIVQSGRCEQALAVAVEAPITPLTLAGFKQMGALATTGCYPFDERREGLVLGEGAVAVVLESALAARRRSGKCYGQVLGFGLTADGHHVSAPDPQRRSSKTALESSLSHAGLSLEQVGYIHAHGTSTHLNDLHEATLLEDCGARAIPISSTKGATGHALGAAGLMGVAFCLLTLHQQLLPPCVGLQHPAMPLNFVRQATPSTVNAALCMSFGFGGQNAVVALGKAP